MEGGAFWQKLFVGDGFDAKPAVRAIQSSKVEGLMSCAARHAFWDMNLSALQNMAELRGLEYDTSWSLFKLCLTLVMRVLKVSEADALDKTKMRVASMSSQLDGETMQALLQLGEGLQVLDKDDETLVRKQQNKLKNQQVQARDFTKEYAQRRQNIPPTPGPIMVIRLCKFGSSQTQGKGQGQVCSSCVASTTGAS